MFTMDFKIQILSKHNATINIKSKWEEQPLYGTKLFLQIFLEEQYAKEFWKKLAFCPNWGEGSFLFIRPESTLPLSLTHSLIDSCLVDFFDVTLAFKNLLRLFLLLMLMLRNALTTVGANLEAEVWS